MRLAKPAVLATAATAVLMSFAVLADDVPVFQPDPAIAAMTADQKVAARESAMHQDGSLLRSASRSTGPEAVAAIDKVLQNFTNFPAWFADGATNSKSGAAPAIWTEFDKFTALIDKGKAELLTMRAAAVAGDAAGVIKGARAVNAVCFECHQSYRN